MIAIDNYTTLLAALTATILLAGCLGPLENLGVEVWTCEVENLGETFTNSSAPVMKTYTDGDCAALVAECRHRDQCRLVKTEDKPEYLLVGLNLSDEQVQRLID